MSHPKHSRHDRHDRPVARETRETVEITHCTGSSLTGAGHGQPQREFDYDYLAYYVRRFLPNG